MLIESMTCIFPPYFLFLFFVCDPPSISFCFHLFFLLRVCLPISVHILSDHSASPQPDPISYLTYCPIFVSQELPTTYVVPTSTLNVGEHSQFDHFSFLIPIHFHPPPTLPTHLPKRPDIILSMTRSRLSPMCTHTLVLLYITIRRLLVSFSFPFWSLFLSSTPWHSPYRSTIPYVSIDFLPIHPVNVHTTPKPRCSA